MATVPRVMLTTQKRIQNIEKKKQDLDKELEELKKQEVLEKQEYLSKVKSVIEEKPEYEVDVKEMLNSMGFFNTVITETFQDALESEDRVESPISLEITDGSIVDEECDEVIDDRVFSSDGPTSNQQLIDILREKGFYVKDRKGKIRPYHSIKKRGCKKKLCIENHITKNINEYIITTIDETDCSSHVLSWSKFCNRSNSNRRKYEFKGKNIVEVISMIDIILS